MIKVITYLYLDKFQVFQFCKRGHFVPVMAVALVELCACFDFLRENTSLLSVTSHFDIANSNICREINVCM